MLRARSVAIVGASERRGSVGDQTVRQLLGGGFEGRVHPINPGYDKIHGLDCLSSLDDLDEPVELVVLAVANAQLEAQLELAAKQEARSVAIFASCHGSATDGSPLRDRLRVIADEAGISICGGNGMGFLNVEDRLRICGFHQPADLAPGGVTFLSHSGSLFSAMLHNRRGIRFNTVVSTGLEINTTMADYLDWALDLDSTRVVALFLETIRNPDDFVAVLRKADRLDVPVVTLKVGASQRGRDAVATHSEAIAGDDAVYEALFEAHGVHRVETMDEMADTLELFGAGRRAVAAGLGAVHDSGGERALLIDTADRVGVSLPTVSEATSGRLAAVLDPGLEPANPVDAWGTGRDAEGVFTECLLALALDEAIGVLAFCVDLTTEEDPDDAYSRSLLQVAGGTAKPVCCIANMGATVDPAQASALRAGGIPVLQGTETGLRAVSHLVDDWRNRTTARDGERRTRPGDPSAGVGGEIEALGVLASYGIPVPPAGRADDPDSVLALAEDIGYPLVLKTDEGHAHKSDVAGVTVGINDPEALRVAYADLAERLGPRVVLAAMEPEGVEMALGMITDPQFGPVVVVSAGGVLVEVLGDRTALLPPVSAVRAREAVDRLSVRRLLDGARGRPPADIDSLVEVIVRFSELAADSSGVVGSIDVNPVIVGHQGAVAVDALMVAG
jgi:acyl-CoA synthetase (NDP forming)